MGLVRHHESYREAARRLGFARAIPYGRGITLLFAGPPGTGKTLFTRAIAHALGRPLLRVHTARLAEAEDKIEAQIAGLFREASLLQALLFFDDCEGLFSKRSSQLAFLLSELERFEGISILATNAPQQMDDAMDRRIVYRLDFESPTSEERLQIWELHLPPEAPIGDDVDLPLLAGLFAFTGGIIKRGPRRAQPGHRQEPARPAHRHGHVENGGREPAQVQPREPHPQEPHRADDARPRPAAGRAGQDRGDHPRVQEPRARPEQVGILQTARHRTRDLSPLRWAARHRQDLVRRDPGQRARPRRLSHQRRQRDEQVAR